MKYVIQCTGDITTDEARAKGEAQYYGGEEQRDRVTSKLSRALIFDTRVEAALISAKRPESWMTIVVPVKTKKLFKARLQGS